MKKEKMNKNIFDEQPWGKTDGDLALWLASFDNPNEIEIIELTKVQFDNISEYSLTIPTGKEIGKTWKRDINQLQMHPSPFNAMILPNPWNHIYEQDISNIWVMGKYTEFEEGEHKGWVKIKWFEIKPKDNSYIPLTNSQGESVRNFVNEKRSNP